LIILRENLCENVEIIMPHHNKPFHKSSLRELAEEKLSENSPNAPLPQTDDVQKIVHELEVHQAELEIQNEELRRSQGELTDSRDSFEELYDFAPVGYLTLDSEGRILKANLTAAKMFGVERSNLTHKSKFSSFVSSTSQDIWHKFRLDVLEGREKKTCELDIVKADQSLLSVNLETAFLLSPDKNNPLLMMAMIDITARKRAEDAQKESEERYHGLFNEDITGDYIADLEGKLSLYNPAFASIFSFSSVNDPSEIFMDDLYPNQEIWKDFVERVRIERKIESFESKRKRLDGSIIHVIENAVGIFDRQGELQGIHGYIFDITERKKAEEALRESEERYHGLFYDDLTGDYISDPEGRLTLYNPSFASIFGFSSDKDPSEIFMDDLYLNQGMWQDFVERVMIEKKIESFESKRKRSDGSTIHVIENAVGIFDKKGEFQGIHGYIFDISERKHAEESLREAYEKLQMQSEELQAINEELQSQSEELQAVNEELQTKSQELQTANDNLNRTNKELDQFAYVASHDLQEPIRLVNSFTQLLGKRYGDRLDEKAKEFMGIIIDESMRMQRLIKDLLDFSRIGRINSEPESINCNKIINRILNVMAEPIKEKNAQVTFDNLPIIFAHETSLTQLFQNFIVNSIKFHRERVPPRVHISARKEDDKWLFSVKDNGIGINQKYFDRLFLIFQRLHAREEYPGTGIGLATCKKIVELHGGKIWVESIEGEGSTFYFTFPC
jgi:PAS domain S-box-containing protein